MTDWTKISSFSPTPENIIRDALDNLREAGITYGGGNRGSKSEAYRCLNERLRDGSISFPSNESLRWDLRTYRYHPFPPRDFGGSYR